MVSRKGTLLKVTQERNDNLSYLCNTVKVGFNSCLDLDAKLDEVLFTAKEGHEDATALLSGQEEALKSDFIFETTDTKLDNKSSINKLSMSRIIDGVFITSSPG